MYRFDQSFLKKVIGVDEAGRGALAGPVVAAAVFCPFDIEGVKDSKLLSAKKREELYLKIMQSCKVGIGIVDNLMVDEINVLNAALLAMKKAIESLDVDFDLILVDGNAKVKGITLKQETIVKGDQKSLCIASASIIAKVTRDRLMDIDSLYNFKKHKGYGTKEHFEMIEKYGLSELHRRSFLKKHLINSKYENL